MKVYHSSNSTEWGTPWWLYWRCEEEFTEGGFDIDPAARSWNAKARRYYSLDRGEDGLKLPWPDDAFNNPPYGRGKVLWNWTSKMVHEVTDGSAQLVVALVPARTDTRWWHKVVMPHAAEVRMLEGRVEFLELGDDGCIRWQVGAPFPSAILVFRRRHTIIDFCCRKPWVVTRSVVISTMPGRLVAPLGPASIVSASESS